MAEPDYNDPEWQTPPDTRPRRPASHESRRGRRARRLMVLGIVGGIVTFGLIVGLIAVVLSGAQTMPVVVIVSGDANAMRTRSATVGELLTNLGIFLGEGDTLDPPAATAITPDLVIRVEKARSVTLTVDGAMRIFRTTLTNPADILARAGLKVGATDRVLVDGTQTTLVDLAVWPVPATHILLRRAMPIRIDDDGSEQKISTTGETVGEALFDAGTMLYLADVVTPSLNEPLAPDMVIKVHRSTLVTIELDGETIQTRTQGTVVADALADAAVALQGLDYSSPSEDAPLHPGMTVSIIRVREEVESEQEKVPFEVVYQADATLPLDQSAVTEAGYDGIRETRTRVRFENGIEVSRETETSSVVQPPVNRVISYGTNVVVRSVDTPDGPREYWRVIRMYATSYHPAALGGDSTTATGHTLMKGIVGANPKVLPYGTQIYVPGYGVGTIEDTGGPRPSSLWVDLGYGDDDFINWHKYVDVYVLTPVPAAIDYRLPG